MTTHFASIDSAYRRLPEVSLLRFIASPSIDAMERKLDEVLVDSFPASDPPPWTFGRLAAAPQEGPRPPRQDEDEWSCHTTVIVPGGSRTAWQWLTSGVGAIGVAMVIPIVILILGIPLALATHAMIDVVIRLLK